MGVLAGANFLLARLFPSLHGEGEPMPASIAGTCLLAAEDGVGPLFACLRDEALNYGWTYYALSTLYAAVFGETYTGALLLTATCFAAALAGVWRIAERLGGRRAGLFALVAFCAFPIIPYYARRVQFEMFQAAIVAWFLVWLLESDGLRDRVRSVGLAVLVAIGVYCKPSTAFFTLPAAFVAFLLLHRERSELPRRLVNLVIVGLGMLPVVSFYRLTPGMWKPATVVADHMVRSRLVFPWVDVDGGTLMSEVRWVTYFGRMFVNYQVGLALAAVAVVALALALRKRRWEELVLWSAYLGAAAIHTTLAYKKFYYTMPGLPAVAAILGVAVARWQTTRLGRPLTVGLALVCLLQILRWNLNVYGPDDLVPKGLHASIGFNDPPAFKPEPPRFAPDPASEMPVLLALAEDDDTLRMLVLPRGGKIASLTTRPELYGWEHTLTYEFERRNVPVRTAFAQHGASLLGSRVVFLYPPVGWSSAQIDPEAIVEGCLELATSRNPDLTERRSSYDCEGLLAEYQSLLPRLDIVHVDSFGPGRLRAMAVIRDRDDQGLTTALAARAWVYAEAMHATDDVPDRVRELAARSTDAEKEAPRAAPLRFRRHGKDQRVFPH